MMILCFLTASCNRYDLFTEELTPHHFNELKTINDTMTSNPEVALELIENFINSHNISSMSDAEFYEYNILLAEARYKCEQNHINEGILINAVNYFNSLDRTHPKNTDIIFQKSKAYYYNGIAKEEKEQYKNAFKNFLQSLQSIEQLSSHSRKNESINHFHALIHVRLGDIMYWLDNYPAAIECLDNANNLFSRENNLTAMARNNIIIATMYGQNQEYEYALNKLHTADSLILLYDTNSPLRNDISRINASIMCNNGYLDEAFKNMLHQYKTLEIPTQKIDAAGLLGDIYYQKGMLDSAIYYYKQYFPDNKYSKINAAHNIIEIAIQTNNEKLITEYAPLLAEETNKELLLSNIKTEISSLYENYKINKDNNNLYEIITIYLMILLGATVVLFLVCLFLLRYKKHKYNREIYEKEHYINSLQEKINKRSSEKKNISNKMKNLESELQEIKTKKYLIHVPFDMKLINLLKNPLCKKISDINQNKSIKINVKYPELQLSDKEQSELVDLFNKTFGNAFNKIISDHKGLKHEDNILFCLYLIGLDEKHISAVTGKSYNIIYNRTKRILEILESKDSIKVTLRNMIVID